MTPSIRVLLVDDHALVREGIRQALSVSGFDVVGEAGTGPEGVAMARALHPDVVLLDISLPGENGLVTAARLRREVPGARVLMLSVYHQQDYILEAVRAGAHGYLLKDTLPAQLRAVIADIAAGRTHFAEVMAAAPAAPPRLPSREAVSRLELLTPRERDVLAGIARGFSNKEIGGQLGVSTRTIESYREALIRKVGIPSVAGLTRLALEAGLIP